MQIGQWVLHVFEEESKEPVIVITTDNSFRISDSLEHPPGETVHKDATVIGSRCIHCGKEDISWIREKRYVKLYE